MYSNYFQFYKHKLNIKILFKIIIILLHNGFFTRYSVKIFKIAL